jgi:hypothetical protein
MRSKGNLLRTTTLAAALLLPGLSWPAEEPSPQQGAPEPVQAIWKDQEFAFYFQSQTTFYSCSTLEAKLKRILEALGARAWVRVRAVDCQSGPVRMPRVSVKMSAPVEATPQAIAEREKGRSKRELAARVRGEKQDPEALAPFPAQWKRVSLSRGGKLDLEPGDCELIDELRRKVLPKLAVRIVKDNTHCTPRQLTLGQPQLELESLVAQPKPDAKEEKK